VVRLKGPSKDIGARIPVGTTAFFETLVAGRRFVSSWARRERLQGDQIRFVSWQELDYAALHRPGGLVRTVTELRLRATLEPLQLAIHSEGGTVHIRFGRRHARARLLDGRRIELSVAPWSLVLLDNAIALYSLLLEALRAQGRLPFTGTVFIPGTFSSLEYSIRRSGKGYETSLGEQLVVDEDGWLRELRLSSSDVVIRRGDARLPRWRTLAPGRQRREPRLPAGLRSRELRCVSGGTAIWARLVTRGGRRAPVAAALIAGGSGIHDRFGMAGDVDLGYGTLAARLAARGIACLQYDKPGAGRTRARLGAAPARFESVIDLARTWLKRLAREVPKGTPLFLIGHSQGGQVALALAARRPRALRGVVLLATAARDIDQVLRQQVLTEAHDLGLDARHTRRRLAQLAAFFAWLRKTRGAEPLPERFQAFASHRDWYRGLLATAPARTLPALRVPLLILQGERDIQVAPGDALVLARLARRTTSDVTTRLWPELDHLFMASPRVEHTGLYADRRRRFSAQAARCIEEWISAHSGDAARTSSARKKSPTITAGKSATRGP
jgi:uncharacterized protein